MPEPTMPAIEVENLAVHFGAKEAVRDVSFSVGAGEIVALLGPNGAGKTSTIETTEGFRRPTRGTVRVLGLDPVDDHERLIASVGVMLQGSGTYPQLSPERALRLFADYYENPRSPGELLETVGLVEVGRTPARRLSGGERQRLSLALSLVGRPRVVFLDEPTAGIDPSGRLMVRAIISQLREDGVAVVLTTHELEEAERLADRVVIIADGEVVASGTLDELRGKDRVIHLSTDTPIAIDEMAGDLGLTVVEEGHLRYRIPVADLNGSIEQICHWLSLHHHDLSSLSSGGQSLEEIFLALTATEEEPNSRSETGRGSRGRRRSR